MAGLGWQELVLILLIVVIIFGAGKLPEIGGAVGRGIKEFKTATSDEQDHTDENVTVVKTTTTTTDANHDNV